MYRSAMRTPVFALVSSVLSAASFGSFVSLVGCLDDSSQSSFPSPDASSAVPDASMSTAPDGSTTPGVDAGRDATPGELLCSKYGGASPLAFQGPVVTVEYRPTLGEAPAPIGGVVVDGTYDLISNIDYGYGTGSASSGYKFLLVLENGAWFYRISNEGGSDNLLFSGGRHSVDTAAKRITFGQPLCGGGGSPVDVLGYSVEGDAFRTILSQDTNPPTIKVMTYRRRT